MYSRCRLDRINTLEITIRDATVRLFINGNCGTMEKFDLDINNGNIYIYITNWVQLPHFYSLECLYENENNNNSIAESIMLMEEKQMSNSLIINMPLNAEM